MKIIQISILTNFKKDYIGQTSQNIKTKLLKSNESLETKSIQATSFLKEINPN